MVLLKQERKKLGLSQAKLAQKADLHPTTVSNIETGNLIPWPGQREKLARALRAEGWDGNPDALFEEAK
jgi:transcriptional regulator with XRE-family HTH domain